MTLEAYELERRIGSGAAGTVWRARRKGPVPQVVALKRLRAGTGSADLDRLRREALVLAALDHPHIVRIIEVLDDGDGIALAMQFAPGGSLAALLVERGRLTAGETVAVAAPIADALGSAHRRNVVHGDVKPANILFTSDGEPLLTDFGVARTLGRLTSDQVTGTATYLAPELLDGGHPDARTDIYALGVLCYELLAGAPPYDGSTPLAIVHAAALGAHRSLFEIDGVPDELAGAVERAMARTPDQRPESAADVASALREAISPSAVHLPGIASRPHAADDGAGGVSGTRTFGPRPPRKEPSTSRRRSWRLPALGAVGAVAIGGVFVLTRDHEPRDCPSFEPVVTTVSGDPEGDGTPTDAAFQIEQDPAPGCAVYGRLYVTIAGEDRTFRIGEPGDQLLLGDWDCDDVDTPAVYRPDTGDVAYHDGWPARGESPAEPRVEQLDAGGTATVVAGEEADCDRVALG